MRGRAYVANDRLRHMRIGDSGRSGRLGVPQLPRRLVWRPITCAPASRLRALGPHPGAPGARLRPGGRRQAVAQPLDVGAHDLVGCRGRVLPRHGAVVIRALLAQIT